MNEERTTSRRRFLGTAAGATGVALAAAAWKPAQAAAAVPDTGRGVQSPINPGSRTFRPGVFQLNLEGVSTGILKSEDGGDAFAEVVSTYFGLFAEKHISNFKYDDFTVQVGLGMSKAVYEWISAAWKANQLRPNGSIVTADQNFQAKSEREFVDAIITETGIPALDASAKQAGFLTLTFAPESTMDKPASGPVAGGSLGVKQKVWTTSNFRLELPGLDTTQVAKIDAFTVKQSIITEAIGEGRFPTREPGKMEFPNLKLALGQTSLPTWAAWFDDFVIKGRNSGDQEKSGRIVFLGPDLKSELAEIKLFGVGIYRLDPDPEDPSAADKIARFTAELYVERMEFNLPPAPVIT